MTDESDSDRITGEWHELAELVKSGAEIDLAAAIALVNSVVDNFVPSFERPSAVTADEIRVVVTRLREFEKTWNQTFMRVLIEAADSRRNGDVERAVAALDRFIEQCPWRSFVTIAETERSNITGGWRQ
jgi:hypothetical protein